MPPNLLHPFVLNAQRMPQATALVVWQRERLAEFTWLQLASMVSAVANELDSGLIGFVGENSLLDVVLPLACLANDSIEVPFDARFGQPLIDRLWSRVEGTWLASENRSRLTRLAIGSANQVFDLERLERRANTIDDSAVSLILWTSGSTASPKGVMLSQKNLAGNALSKLKAVPQDTKDVRLTSLPLSHGYARTSDYGTWLLSGCTLAIGLGYGAFRQLAARVFPTLANVVPSLAARLMEDKELQGPLNRLRLLGCGGAAISEQDFLKWKARGVTVIQGYGLTETSPVICSAGPGNAAPGLVGGFVEGWEHQIRDGRLWVRGPHLMLGYWGDPLATKARLDSDGWFDTGDLVELDAAFGQLRILGRADDVIVLQNGRKINPVSVESQVQQIDGIRYAMLVSDSEHVDLWIDLDDTAAEISGLRETVRDSLREAPQWQQPRKIRVFDPPLSIEKSEISTKGVLRRKHVLATRFGRETPVVHSRS